MSQAASQGESALTPEVKAIIGATAEKIEAKNASSTCLSGARSPSELPTSKGPDVPRPRAGIASPVDGILRVIALSSRFFRQPLAISKPSSTLSSNSRAAGVSPRRASEIPRRQASSG